MGNDKNIVMYSTPTCVHCQKAKRFFEKKGIEYTDYNVSEDIEKRQEMAEKTDGKLSVPVIEIGEDVLIGFNENKISELLELE